MSKHDYTPNEALETLLSKLQEKDLSLEAAVRSAIDLGKDVTEEQRLGRRKIRKYRKTVPFTHEEALHVSLSSVCGHTLWSCLSVSIQPSIISNLQGLFLYGKASQLGFKKRRA